MVLRAVHGGIDGVQVRGGGEWQGPCVYRKAPGVYRSKASGVSSSSRGSKGTGINRLQKQVNKIMQIHLGKPGLWMSKECLPRIMKAITEGD